MAELVKNDKGFKVIKLSVDEAASIGFGLYGSGICVCAHCNKCIISSHPTDVPSASAVENEIIGDIYYIAALNDTMCKDCYEEWYKDAVNYPEDRQYEERTFRRVAKLLNLQ